MAELPLEVVWFDDICYKIWQDEDAEPPCDDYERCFLGKCGRYGRPGWVFKGEYIEDYEDLFMLTSEGHYVEAGNAYALFPVGMRGNQFFIRWSEPQLAITAVYVRLRSDLEQLAYLQSLTLAEEAQEKLDELNRWTNGEAYGFTIENREGEILESCWGFDTTSDCEEEALAIIKLRTGERQ